MCREEPSLKKPFSLPCACAGLIAAAALAGAAGCATPPPPPAAEQLRLTGQAAYRERIALPPNAVFEATLEDVSRADAPSTVLARSRLKPAGNPPFAYTLAVPRVQLRERARYVVRARVTVDGRLWFTTDRAHPVNAGAAEQRIDLPLRRVAQQPPETQPPRALENTYWKLVTLHGEPVTVADRQREPHLILQPERRRLVGFSGCNRLAGSYTLDGDDKLTFGRTAGTLMACADGLAQERRFLDALGTVAHWRVRGQELDLLDAQRRVLATFAAVDLR
jgi:putative lipoprotein